MRDALLTWIFGDGEATYVRDIQVLRPDKPLPLPPIQPLKARVESEADRATRRQKQDRAVSRFLAHARRKTEFAG